MTLFWFIIALMLLTAVSCVIVPIIVGQSASSTKCKQWTIAALVIVMPILAMTLYWQWGNSQALSRYLIMREQSTQQLQGLLKSPDEIIRQLKIKLQQDPQSAQGWYLLGRLYFSQQRFDEATAAFRQANILQPNVVDTMVQYAQSLYISKQPQAKKQAIQLTKQVLQQQPQNEMALNLLALDAYNHQRYQEALDIWQALLPRYPENSVNSKMLRSVITRAQAKLPRN